jgi:hypothetical protein
LGHVKPRLLAVWAGTSDERAPEWQRDFRKALHRRINRKGSLPVVVNERLWNPCLNALGYRQGWRKLDSDYQIALWRDSRRLHDIAKRIRVYQFETVEARSRFSHLLANHGD